MGQYWLGPNKLSNALESCYGIFKIFYFTKFSSDWLAGWLAGWLATLITRSNF